MKCDLLVNFYSNFILAYSIGWTDVLRACREIFKGVKKVSFLSERHVFVWEMQYVFCGLTIGVGYTVVKNAFLAELFLGQFFVFHSIYLNRKWQNFRFQVQEKSVQRPLVTLYPVFVMGVDLSLKSIKDLLFWHVAMILVSNHV